MAVADDSFPPARNCARRQTRISETTQPSSIHGSLIAPLK
jgi:hypothetical protein